MTKAELNNLMGTLEDAILLATEAHKGQKDKAGAPYILHPLRVMLRMESETEKIVAVLHDVLEDTWVSESDLEDMGFSKEVIEAVNILTKNPALKDPYKLYILNVKKNPIARKVKLADLEDNMDIKRISAPTEKDLNRISKYRSAWDFLKDDSFKEMRGETIPSVSVGENNGRVSLIHDSLPYPSVKKTDGVWEPGL